MRDITQIVETEIVNNIDNTVRVVEVIEIDDAYYVLRLCDVKWLKIGRSIEDVGGNFYNVSELDRETGVIKVIRPNAVDQIKKRDVLTIIRPTYIHGTRTTANNEWGKMVGHDVRFKIPIIWLAETTNEPEYPRDSPKEVDSNLVLYFLDEIDVVDSLNDQQREQGVRPMLELEHYFMEAIEESYELALLQSANRKTFSRFGNEDKSGISEWILDANLGGVEIRPTITIYKKVGCKC
jgi:hypothetical protein